MTLPKFNPVDKVIYGGLAIAGTGAYLGYKHDTENQDTGDKMKAGIAATGMAAAAGYGLWKYGPRRLASNAWGGARRYTKQMNSGLPGWRKYATAPALVGAGAAIGAMVGGEDHRGKGALIGAGAGVAAGALIHGGGAWSRMGSLGKFGVFAGVASLAFGAGERSSRAEAHAAAVANPETGETEYVSPEVAQQMRSGAGRRSRNLKASGDLVFGLNAGRRG